MLKVLMFLQQNKMRILIPALSIIFMSCGGNADDFPADNSGSGKTKKPCLTCIHDSDERVALLNERGDTIAPFGRFDYCFFETTHTFGSVYDSQRGGFYALDATGKELYEVFGFDNGPDYVEEGLFRIVIDEKIGYANEDGEIVIQPQYSCAYPFEDGKAMVTFNCTKTIEFEMTKWESEEWFYIDKTGKKVE